MAQKIKIDIILTVIIYNNTMSLVSKYIHVLFYTKRDKRNLFFYDYTLNNL